MLPIKAPKAEQFDPTRREWKPIDLDAREGRTTARLHLEAAGAALLRWK
jgi:hypothetical protein